MKNVWPVFFVTINGCDFHFITEQEAKLCRYRNVFVTDRLRIYEQGTTKQQDYSNEQRN